MPQGTYVARSKVGDQVLVHHGRQIAAILRDEGTGSTFVVWGHDGDPAPTPDDNAIFGIRRLGVDYPDDLVPGPDNLCDVLAAIHPKLPAAIGHALTHCIYDDAIWPRRVLVDPDLHLAAVALESLGYLKMMRGTGTNDAPYDEGGQLDRWRADAARDPNWRARLIHECSWGPVETARFTGNPYRRCEYGCGAITLDIDLDNEEGDE